jgi:hypothetical protein
MVHLQASTFITIVVGYLEPEQDQVYCGNQDFEKTEEWTITGQ